MLDGILLSFAAILLALSTTAQVFTGTKSPVAAGLTGISTILVFMWATGYSAAGLLIVACLLGLASQAPS